MPASLRAPARVPRHRVLSGTRHLYVLLRILQRTQLCCVRPRMTQAACCAGEKENQGKGKSALHPAGSGPGGPTQTPAAAAMVSTPLATMTRSTATHLPPHSRYGIGARQRTQRHSVSHRRHGSGTRRRQTRSRRPSGAACQTSTTRRCMVRHFAHYRKPLHPCVAPRVRSTCCTTPA
jgi:hypothetical protein